MTPRPEQPMPDIQFYLIRLSKSSPGDILHRIVERLRIKLLQKFPRLFGPKAPPLEECERRLAQIELPLWKASVSREALDYVLTGGVFTLHAEKERIRAYEDDARGLFFSAVKPRNDLVDIRCVWEPARLQHLTLALAALGEPRESETAEALKAFVRQGISAWIGRNEFAHGPHYMSAMECGLRIPVFVAALKLADFTAEERRLVLKTVYEHAWLIRRRLSLYSSLGNHTVCECVGLVFAGALFGGQGGDWLAKGFNLLDSELFHQVLPDGGPAEQSLSYHRFVLDMYHMTADFARQNSLYPVDGWSGRLEQGERFYNAFVADEQSQAVPDIGDSDTGSAIAPGVAPRRPDARAVWRKTGDYEYAMFPESGYTVVRGPRGLFVTLDHGPLGMAPLFNHGHADALSLTLHVGGRPFWVDPGTYSYNADPRLRRYFKGTAAHNTVIVDGRDQAVMLTGNVWKASYAAGCEIETTRGGEVVINAEHDGYWRKGGGVVHKRSVRLDGGGVLVVEDSFAGTGVHDFELIYHLHPDVALDMQGASAVLRNSAERVCLSLENHRSADTVMPDVRQGWFSRSYGTVQRSKVLHWKIRGECGDARFTTRVRIENHAD